MDRSLVMVALLLGNGCSKSGGAGKVLDLAVPEGDAGACGDVPALRLSVVASGLTKPTFVGSAPGDDTRLFVLERAGLIKMIKDGAVAVSPFLDLSASVGSNELDDGLLGLAFHPDYEQNGRFFVDYTDTTHYIAIAELKRATADIAEPQPVRRLMTIAAPAQIRFGGMLAFGPDHYLYIGVGDGDQQGAVNRNALNLSLQLGKILRIDVDLFPAAPAGNLTGSGVDPQIWDYGFREPWRFSFDRLTGDLYIGDVGDQNYEEVNIERPGDGRRNYGWGDMEGSHCSHPDCDMTGLTLPAAEYPNTNGCAIIGGYVYRGNRNPCLQGWYLYADHCNKDVRALYWTGTSAIGKSTVTFDGAPALGKLSSFGQDQAGELYLADYDDGIIYRIDPK